MNLVTFLQFVLAPVGLSSFIISPSEIISLWSSFTAETWGIVFRPDVVVSSIIYMSFIFALYFICFVIPYRFLKLWIKVPDKNGVRK